MLRTLGSLALLAATACTALFGAPPPEPEAKDSAQAPPAVEDWAWVEDEDDEESGVRRLSTLIRQSKQALSRKEFDASDKYLRRAEQGLREASVVTRSHPDFEDIGRTVERARKRLEVAIEKDRIERRNAAIDALIRRGTNAMQKGGFVLEELRSRVPIDQDLSNLKEVLAEVADIERLGVEFIDDPRYADHAKKRTDLAVKLRERLHDAEWQIRATQAVAAPVKAGYEATQAARQSEAVQDQVAAYSKVSDSFAECHQALAKLEEVPSHSPDLPIETLLGKRTVEETKRQCLKLGEQARKQVDKLRWREQVARIVDKVNAALERTRADQSAHEALQAVGAAVESMVLCQGGLSDIANAAGAQPKSTFKTALGVLTVSRFVRACAVEQSRLSRRQPQLRWLVDVEELQTHLKDTYTEVTEASQASQPSASAKAWQSIIQAFEGCVSTAKELAVAAAADRAMKVVTPMGELSLEEIGNACGRQAANAKAKRAEAVEAARLQTFIDKCRGDEKEVAGREGIPTRIEDVRGGRVFFYEPATPDKGKPRRFGFDASGRREDFWAKWRTKADSLVDELRTPLGATRGGDGAAQMKALQAALPVLDTCRHAPRDHQGDPGYDAEAKLDTPFGKHTLKSLAAACDEEIERLERRKAPLAWQVELERLAARADEANTQLLAAAEAGDAKTRVQLVGTAMGGFTECTERAEALVKQQHADAKLKVSSGLGSLTARDLGKACKNAHAKSAKAMDEALEARKLEAFLETCRGDELAVAKREGQPTRIDKVGDGRVFVYEPPTSGGKRRKKADAKRYAFDANGRRVNEMVLKQQ